jgi:hypothetical protein
MAIITEWVMGRTKSHSDVGFARFNSGLTFNRSSATSNAELTIWLRLLFLPSTLPSHQKEVEMDNFDGTKTKVGIRHWKSNKEDPNEFGRFVTAVKALAEAVWDRTELCIIPPKDYDGLNWPRTKPTHRLNINCRFQVVTATSAADAHDIIQCTRIDESSKAQFIRSWMDASNQRGAFDSGDVPPAMLSKNAMGIGSVAFTTFRNTIPHELGHAIGLPHIGVLTNYATCLAAAQASPSEGTNVSQCYDGPTADDGDNIMGGGWKTSLHNCAPWFWRAMAHCPGTDHRTWRIFQGKRPPTPL